MKLINPIQITASVVKAYSVDQDCAIWSETQTFNKGARVVLDALGIVAYESMIDNNINQHPESSSNWLKLGSSNRGAMFDAKNGSQTIAENSISVTLKSGELINAIGLINIDAKSITVTMVDVTDGVVYERTVITKTKNSTDWYSFYFGDFIYKDAFVFLDLPAYRNADITITIENDGGTAKIGSLVVGKVEIIGDTNWGARLGFSDYSRKDKDEFGNYTITERAYANNIDAAIDIDTSRIPYIRSLRSSLRAKPVVWIGALPYEDTIVYGFFSNFEINLSNVLRSNASITINGLT